MLFEQEELEQVSKNILKGRSPKVYLAEGTKKLVLFLHDKPEMWKSLGPYFGVAKQLLEKYQPEFDQVQAWGEVPDYLDHYDRGTDILNLVAVLLYLNREGDYVNHPDQPHSIVMPDESRVMFLPGIGIVEN